MKTNTTERQLASSHPAGFLDLARPGKRKSHDSAPSLTDHLTHAERLVYLAPEGFDARRFVEGQNNGKALFRWEAKAAPQSDAPETTPYTFFGILRDEEFALEVRRRSVTIASDRFDVRRDLLLTVKEFIEGGK